MTSTTKGRDQSVKQSHKSKVQNSKAIKWHNMDCEVVNGDKPCRCGEPNHHVGAFRVMQFIWKSQEPFFKFEKDIEFANGVLN